MNIDGSALATMLGSWSLTFLLHATVLLSGAALAATGLRRRPDLEEAAWKLALVGGLLTSSLQLALAAARAAAPGTDPGATPAPTMALALEPLATPASAAAESWRAWLIGAWAAVALLLLMRLASSSLRLHRRLADRRLISAGPLAGLVARLARAAGRRRGVRLSRTEAIPVPIALGGEICLPERALRELPPDEQETVVAHELAHVLRRDPAWLLAGRALGAILFFHPLVLLAGRRLRRVAELRCDDWAAEVTGRPLALARCLTRVAAWDGEALPAAAMAGEPRWLTGRVTRLLERERPVAGAATPRWVRPAGGALLLALALALPGISLAGDPAPQEAAVAPTAPQAPDPVIAPPAASVPAVAPIPAPAPLPVVPPLPPRPAFAIPAPGPLPPAELAEIEAAVARELARLDARLAAEDVLVRAGLAKARQEQAEEGVEEHLRRELERRQRLSDDELRELAEHARQAAAEARLLGEAQRETLEAQRRLTAEQREELRAMAGRLAKEHQQMAEELAAERQALAEEARRIAEEAGIRARDLAADRDSHRRQARLLAEEAERVRAELMRDRERLVPELERLREELRLRTEEREELRRQLEEARRELEAKWRELEASQQKEEG